MKNKFLYLLFLVVFIVLGFYVVELRENVVELENLKIQEGAGNMKRTENIKQAEIDNLQKQINNLEAEIILLESKKIELNFIKDGTINILNLEIAKLNTEIILLENKIKELPTRLEEKLEDLTWVELKEFLKKDKTNEIIFDDKTFDCSGFAITLFRNARAYGIRTAYVEVIFEGYGHALNKFKTTDRGYVFVDNTGNRYGTGLDAVAYIKQGELFGTIYIGAVFEERIDCTRINLCADFINPLPIKKHTRLFNYSYFEAVISCDRLFSRCSDELNAEIKRFNVQQSHLNLEQLKKWIENNKKLLNELTKNNKFIFTELKKVTNIEIYW